MFRTFALALVPALVAPTTARAAPDELAQVAVALQAKAPAVLQHAQKRGFKNIGVLKFLVKIGDAPPRDDVGDLNLALAHKTEDALVQVGQDENFGILDNPSSLISREDLKIANHTTEKGRKAFFFRKYPTRWGRDEVDASGFVTGTATVSADLKSISIRLEVFDATGKTEDIPGAFSAAADLESLAQAGKSFAATKSTQKALISGGPLPTREDRQKEAIGEMLRVSDPPVKANPVKPVPFEPLVNSPVVWTVLYNDQPVAINGDRIPEPPNGAKVSFKLRNPGPGTYAVVLLVNGRNTLYEEQFTPFACRKWVLEPRAEVTVEGFQTGPNESVPFKVLPPEKVNPNEFRYGEHAGTFRLVVFHGKTSTTPPADTNAGLKSDELSAMALARTRGPTLPEGGIKPQSLEAVQADIRGRAKAGVGARGYVTKGDTAKIFETEAVYFHPSSDIPVADISLRYFDPRP